jgi:hypothetical protein
MAPSGTSPQFIAHDSSQPGLASFAPPRGAPLSMKPKRHRETFPHAPQT